MTKIVGGAILVGGWPLLEAGLKLSNSYQRTMLAVALPAMAQVASTLGACIAQLTARYTVRVSVWLIPVPLWAWASATITVSAMAGIAMKRAVSIGCYSSRGAGHGGEGLQ